MLICCDTTPLRRIGQSMGYCGVSEEDRLAGLSVATDWRADLPKWIFVRSKAVSFVADCS